MGVLFQVIKIITEVQRKMNNEKITRREIDFPIYKTCFFFFFVGTPLIFKPHIIIFLIHFK
jgi:hypothetical protein